MANKINKVAKETMIEVISNVLGSTNDHCTRGRSNPIASAPSDRIIQARPARRIGKMLAMQQIDGVDGTINNLFKGQYDDAYGDVDPASDIHTDPHIFQDQLMQAGFAKMDDKPVS